MAGQGIFHHLEAVVQVVLDGPGHGFFKGDRAGDRFLIGEQRYNVFAHPLSMIGQGQGFRRNRTTRQHQR